MRQPMFGAWAAAGLVALCACAQSATETTGGGSPAASAQGYAAPASAVGQTPQQGYSSEARRIADCAASFPNYDVRTDTYQADGVTRRCPL